MKKNTQSGYGAPLGIVVTGVLIAGAIVFVNTNSEYRPHRNSDNEGFVSTPRVSEFRMPNAGDHIRGNPQAPIKIVEFSDFECPFCARLHITLDRIIKENEDVAWIYRHFPLTTHARAFSAAIASECIARSGGNSDFWDFTDTAFKNQRKLDNAFYTSFVNRAEIDSNIFATCLKDSEIIKEIERDLTEVALMGGRGTPHVIVVTEDNQLISFSGALPYEQILGIIERARNN